jgi:hypothetical protein
VKYAHSHCLSMHLYKMEMKHVQSGHLVPRFSILHLPLHFHTHFLSRMVLVLEEAHCVSLWFTIRARQQIQSASYGEVFRHSIMGNHLPSSSLRTFLSTCRSFLLVLTLSRSRIGKQITVSLSWQIYVFQINVLLSVVCLSELKCSVTSIIYCYCTSTGIF